MLTRPYRENESTFVQSKLNEEIETWYAQYPYVSSLPEYTLGSPWCDLYNKTYLRELVFGIRIWTNISIRKAIRLLQTLLSMFTLRWLNKSFRNLEGENGDKPYKNYPYDDNRVGISNFKNLQQLSLNCN